MRLSGNYRLYTLSKKYYNRGKFSEKRCRYCGEGFVLLSSVVTKARQGECNNKSYHEGCARIVHIL